MRRLLIGCAAVMLVALAACGDDGGLDRLAAGERGRVVQVRSGDVLVLESGLVVRLAGLETPRWGEPGADAARNDLERLAAGREVELFYGGARRDAYGRALAQVRLADGRRWVEQLLLSDGVAEVRTYPDNRALAGQMLAREAAARQRGRGLWARRDAVRLPSEIGDRDAGFDIVEGRVTRATPTGGGVYLDFDGARSGFAAQIVARALADFDRAGLAPRKLSGRLIRVRGVIGGDGLMRLDHPEQVELLKAG